MLMAKAREGSVDFSGSRLHISKPGGALGTTAGARLDVDQRFRLAAA